MIFISVTIILAVSFLINKFQKTVSVAALVTDAFLMANPAVRHTADYNLYKLSYTQQLENFEKGYTLLAKLFYNWGLPYETFRVYLACAIFIIVGVAIFRLSKNPSLVVLGYNIALFTIEAIQIRNMIMVALALLGFSLLKRGRRVSSVAGVSVLFLATTFHTLGYFFLFGGILFFVPWKYFLNGLKIISYGTLPLSIMFLMFGVESIQRIFATFLSLTGARSDFSVDLVSVYNNAIGFKSWLLTIFIVVTLLFPFFLRIQSIRTYFYDPDFKNVLIPTFLAVLSVILTLLSSDYVRLLRDASVFAFVSYSQLVDRFSHKRLIVLSYVLVIAGAIFWLQNFAIYPESGRYIAYTIGLIPDSAF
ncbi:EpsG family protein [Lacticaseibacillus paracasei]|uniref:EpsG family protein n=1 Tax=Lacticaseibacillus paracasei TaxID=1597 RepID=UPI00194FB2EE|nr:EpsG family protein [Lacticaseibacillus paracasei]MBM6413375.1 EpsG family protein [Lacticaseibacillus paracasei]